MKAVVLDEPGDLSSRPLRISEVPRPEGGPGQVLLRVRACGVCRTDLHIVEGEIPLRLKGLIPGHQIVGDVVGGATAELPAGTRVGVSWIGGTDGDCWYCRHHHENLCDSPTFTGYSVNGGYAEYVLARADFVFPLPPPSTTCTLRRFCAPELSGSGRFELREFSRATMWVYTDLALPPISPLRS